MMFLQFFIWGSWYVTMGTYLGEIGFAGSDIGDAYSTMALGAIVAPLFIGMIADKFFPAEKVLGVMHLLGAVFIYWASTVTDPSTFYFILLVFAFCYMPTLALVNAIAFHQMQNPEKEFPNIRVLGTIGWIVAGLLLSGLDLFLKGQDLGDSLSSLGMQGTLSAEKGIEYTNLPFLIGAIASVLLGLYAFVLPATPPQSKNVKKSVFELLGLDAIKLMKNRNFAILIISSFLISIPLSFYYSFANAYLNESGMQFTASKMSLGQVSEILFMLLMPLMFIRLGVKKMIVVGMLAWVLRYVLFAFGDNDTMVWMFYGGIILHGICYDFFFVTGQIYVDNKAPEAIRSSAQGFITLVTYGLGMYIGTILAGKVVENYTIAGGGHHWFEIWMIPAVIAVVVTLAFLVLFKNDDSKEKIVI